MNDDQANLGLGSGVRELRPADVVRYIGPVTGRYTLPSQRDRDVTRIFACRIQSISAYQAVLIAPVLGREGEEIAARFDAFGLVKGRISRLVDDAMVMEFDLTDQERHRLATRVAWYKKKVQLSLPEKRRHRRFPPRDPMSELILHDGDRITCFVIDVSASGVAVSAGYAPRLGEPLAVGQLVGRVVRERDDGFALEFVDEQDPSRVEERLTAYTQI